ncbi:MAG: alanine racemase [Deltaproteobacteria bacterium]|nr:alanine racemase [Deltaproteobacteria bacterium]
MPNLRTRAEINLKNISHNVRQFKEIIPEGCEMLAVVKADGYGHGAVEVLTCAVKAGVTWAGVALVEEAVELREAGFTLPILLLGGWFPEGIEVIYRHDITPMIYSMESLRLLSEYSKTQKEPLKVHLKLDTGMGRLGLDYAQLELILKDASYFDNLILDGVASHFSSADDEDREFTLGQLTEFHQRVAKIRESFDLNWVHIANSAGCINYDQDRGNLFRLGISLYGMPPSARGNYPIDLKESLSWKTSIVQLKWLPPGSPVSYNRTYHTKRPSLIATLPVGYADGYSRHLSNNSEVLIRGQRANLIGRVCMDMILVDVTHIDGVRLYDEVVLIGTQKDQLISATDMAELAGTINYETTCAISKRVPRLYL